MRVENLYARIAAGRIKRYHTHPINGEQSVGEHTYNVVQMLRHLTEDDLRPVVILAAMDHDVAEIHTGDIPWGAKKAAPYLKAAVNEVEKVVNASMEAEYVLTEKEQDILHCADYLEMGLFGLHQMRLGNTYGEQVTYAILTHFAGVAHENQLVNDMVDAIEREYSATKRG